MPISTVLQFVRALILRCMQKRNIDKNTHNTTYSYCPLMTTTTPTQPHVHHYHHHSLSFFLFLPRHSIGYVVSPHPTYPLAYNLPSKMVIRRKNMNIMHHQPNDQLQTHVVHNLDELVINTISFSIYTAKYAKEVSASYCVLWHPPFCCSHNFHLNCIEAWLRKKPNCLLYRSTCLSQSLCNYRCDRVIAPLNLGKGLDFIYVTTYY